MRRPGFSRCGREATAGGAEGLPPAGIPPRALCMGLYLAQACISRSETHDIFLHQLAICSIFVLHARTEKHEMFETAETASPAPSRDRSIQARRAARLIKAKREQRIVVAQPRRFDSRDRGARGRDREADASGGPEHTRPSHAG